MDYGGEGPLLGGPYDAPQEHFVYIALKPLPPQTAEERQAAASARLVASGEAAVLAQLEASNPYANAMEIMDNIERVTTDDRAMEVDS